MFWFKKKKSKKCVFWLLLVMVSVVGILRGSGFFCDVRLKLLFLIF